MKNNLPSILAACSSPDSKNKKCFILFSIQSNRSDRMGENEPTAAVTVSIEQHHQIYGEMWRERKKEEKHKSKQTKQSTTINYFIMMIPNKVLV